MKSKRTAILLVVSTAILLSSAWLAFSQMNDPSMDGRGMGGQGAGQNPMLMGEVVSVDENSLSIMTQSGERTQVTRTTYTSYVKETAVDRSTLKQGGRVFLLGQSSGQNRITPMVIRILVQNDNMPEPRGPGGPMTGGQSGDQMMNGPVIGTITGLNPLTIQQASGASIVIDISDNTKILQETPVKPTEIVKGSLVRIIAAPKPGSSSREARKVILLSEDRLAQVGVPPGGGHRPELQAVTAAHEERSTRSLGLLPDLISRADNPDFLYGIWLGRGPYSNEELDRAFRVVHNLGIRYFLVEFKWDYLEPVKGQWRWTNRGILDVDHVIELARSYNVALVPYFDLFTPWGERRRLNPQQGECEGPPSGRGQFQSPVPEEYATYVFSTVDRLRRNGVAVPYVVLDNEDSNLNDGYQSWNCFINVTAQQLKTVENAAYDRIKAVYPDVKVSSTTFSFPGIAPMSAQILENDRTRKNSFVQAYFGENPRPKFDFLAIHETLSGSGNPFTTLQKPSGAAYEYNFSSYNEGYAIWRKILDRYGFNNVPIINTESDAILKNIQDAELIQKAVFARENAAQNNVRGWVLSMLYPSSMLSAGAGERNISIGISKLGQGYQLREGYFGYYTMLSKMAAYPNFDGTVQGVLNKQVPWVDRFGSGNRILYIAFLPYQLGSDATQPVSVQALPNREVIVTRSDSTSFKTRSNGNGIVTVEVGQHPLFIEVGNLSNGNVRP